MPIRDPIKRREACHRHYIARRAAAAEPFLHLWDAVPMLLAVWCAELRAELPTLEALWSEVVTAWISPGWDDRETPDKEGPATRVMGRLSGREFQICEIEGTDVLAELKDQEADFRWATVFQATHGRVARRPTCPCCIGLIEVGKTEQRSLVGGDWA